MPIFDIECNKCKKQEKNNFLWHREVKEGIKCKCGGTLKPIYNAARFITKFVGGGFYATENLEDCKKWNGKTYKRDLSQANAQVARELTKKHPEHPVVPVAYR